MASWWSPTTDGGVLIQVIATIALAGALVFAARRERAVVLLIVGITMVVVGWYGIRGLH